MAERLGRGLQIRLQRFNSASHLQRTVGCERNVASGRMNADVILADDERLIRQSIVELLETAGYSVRAAKNGEEAQRLYLERRPDLLLLDVMMPKVNGYEVCETVRKTDAETPILFLTALDSDVDELRGLGVGADAYISKTVSNEVLLARIAAAIRRHRHDDPTGDFDFADWHVDPAKLSMRRANDSPVPLAEREVALLRWFAGHPDEVFSRDFLFTRFWGADFEGGDSTLSMAIKRLREKLGGRGGTLESIRGCGYAYRPISHM